MKIDSFNALEKVLQENEKMFLLLHKSGSERSECALERLLIAKESANSPLFTADVTTVRDIHTKYNITSAPSLLEFSEGRLMNVIRGCQTKEYYNAALTGSGFSLLTAAEGKPAKRVTVYTTPTCTWCNTIKTYFREKNIHFTEVNVAADQKRAEEMVKKSGQQGVPQTDINGQVIVGFDKNRINELLEIK
jgi:glutaredoxin-like YruB-family protein